MQQPELADLERQYDRFLTYDAELWTEFRSLLDHLRQARQRGDPEAIKQLERDLFPLPTHLVDSAYQLVFVHLRLIQVRNAARRAAAGGKTPPLERLERQRLAAAYGDDIVVDRPEDWPEVALKRRAAVQAEVAALLDQAHS